MTLDNALELLVKNVDHKYAAARQIIADPEVNNSMWRPYQNAMQDLVDAVQKVWAFKEATSVACLEEFKHIENLTKKE